MIKMSVNTLSDGLIFYIKLFKKKNETMTIHTVHSLNIYTFLIIEYIGSVIQILNVLIESQWLNLMVCVRAAQIS